MKNFSKFCVFLIILGMTPISALADGMEVPEPGVRKKAPLVRASQNKATAAVRKTGKSGNTSPLSEFDLAKYQYCGKDSDCVVAINGCCDCANGGPEIALNADRLTAFRSRFECLRVSCGDKPADPPCGSGVVSCISHRCTYLPGS